MSHARPTYRSTYDLESPERYDPYIRALKHYGKKVRHIKNHKNQRRGRYRDN